MRNGGSASLSVVRRAGRTGRLSEPPLVMTPVTAVEAVGAIPPVAAAIAAVGRTHPAAIAAAAEAGTRLVAEAAAVTPTAHARCIRQYAQSVDGRRKSLSSHALTSRCTAVSASSCAVRQRRRGATTTSTRVNASEPTWAAREGRPHFVYAGLKPGPFTHAPGIAPVCTPQFNTCTPLTHTSRTPVDSW